MHPAARRMQLQEWIDFIKEHEPAYPRIGNEPGLEAEAEAATAAAAAAAANCRTRVCTLARRRARPSEKTESAQPRELRRIGSRVANHPSRNREKLPDWQFVDGWFAKPRPFSKNILAIVEDDIEQFSIHTRSQLADQQQRRKRPPPHAYRKMEYASPGQDSPGPIYYTRSEPLTGDRKPSFGFGDRTNLTSNVSPGPVYFPNASSQHRRSRTASLNAGGRHTRYSLYDPDLVGEGSGKYYYPAEAPPRPHTAFSPIRHKRRPWTGNRAPQPHAQNTGRPSVSVLAIMHELDARLPPPDLKSIISTDLRGGSTVAERNALAKSPGTADTSDHYCS